MFVYNGVVCNKINLGISLFGHLNLVSGNETEKEVCYKIFITNHQEIGPMDSLDLHELEDEDDNDPFFLEWHEKMQMFHPKNILSFDIGPKTSEVFYETVKKEQVKIRGMFFTLSKDEEMNIVLMIKSPSGEILYKKDAADGIFSIDVKHPGEYEFHISNGNWLTPVGVTLAVGLDTHSVLQSKHLQNTNQRLQKLKDNVDSVYAQFKHIWIHNNRQMQVSRQAQRNLLIYALVQFLVITTCSLMCIVYVKRLVSNKRML
ncbi:bifunctional GOLD domain/Transmembrane emp24 domain-containing protein [Babesia duncani]|uniref:Bifunctional GOLD domain/Transmembrane emp24 domain-containing protein n=1 Tax=Babesia duncani TaxID=323732 RepID=A0AAD9UPW7_9APIC|nr:bifunctional GOLD domain/Transmembrane emp24 domain-containing protein [Babesia duncani]